MTTRVDVAALTLAIAIKDLDWYQGPQLPRKWCSTSTRSRAVINSKLCTGEKVCIASVALIGAGRDASTP
jgi:hypothetical protein